MREASPVTTVQNDVLVVHKALFRGSRFGKMVRIGLGSVVSSVIYSRIE